jgi:hypothetical protein
MTNSISIVRSRPNPLCRLLCRRSPTLVSRDAPVALVIPLKNQKKLTFSVVRLGAAAGLLNRCIRSSV